MKYSNKDFTVSKHPQRTAGWYAERAGIPSASKLGDLFDTLKNGTPSAKSKEYRKQLAFERAFETTFDTFQTKAMADGVFFEDFAKQLYIEYSGNTLTENGSYVSPWLIVTPDALVDEKGDSGVLECKVVGDNTFMDVLENGVPSNHAWQLQAQLLATGFMWADYIVVNIKTRAYVVKRVSRDEAMIQEIYDRLHEELELPDISAAGVKRFTEDEVRNYIGDTPLEQGVAAVDLPF